MTLRVGDRVPDVALTHMSGQGPTPLSRQALFSGRRVALFAVPGAFTPACSDQHLPSVIDNAAALKAAGIDQIACLSVNDIFVMRAWGRERGVGADILMLADGAAAWTRAAGLDWDLGDLGLGIRSQRYALVADDGIVAYLAVEQGGAFDVSGGAAVLEALRSR
ncbi:MAG: peroxiredoxin [Pseudomonadota bacterium]